MEDDIQFEKWMCWDNTKDTPTLIVVVLHSDETPPGGPCLVDYGLSIQWFDGEGIDNTNKDPLCR